MVTFTLLTEVEPGTVTHAAGLGFKPLPSELVCTSKRQPVWSAGQESVSMLPLTLAVTLVGLTFTVAVNRNVPSVVSVLVFQASPGAGIEGTMAVNQPE